jgi:hypothetical protein
VNLAIRFYHSLCCNFQTHCIVVMVARMGAIFVTCQSKRWQLTWQSEKKINASSEYIQQKPRRFYAHQMHNCSTLFFWPTIAIGVLQRASLLPLTDCLTWVVLCIGLWGTCLLDIIGHARVVPRHVVECLECLETELADEIRCSYFNVTSQLLWGTMQFEVLLHCI